LALLLRCVLRALLFLLDRLIKRQLLCELWRDKLGYTIDLDRGSDQGKVYTSQVLVAYDHCQYVFVLLRAILVDLLHDVSKLIEQDLDSLLTYAQAAIFIVEKEFCNTTWLPILESVHFLHADEALSHLLLLCEIVFGLHDDAILSEC
jgi:hypothetical protein